MPESRIPDLGRLRKPPEEGRKLAQIGSEILNGMRCGGCFRRIEHGVKLIGFKPQVGANGQPQMQKRQAAACLREDCDYAKSQRSSAIVMEPMEYVWLSGDPDPDGKLGRQLASE